MVYHTQPRPDAFTQRCRDLVRTFTYEDILACTLYAPPMLFMLGPAAIIANAPLVTLILQSLVGFALSGMVHRIGHRLLTALPNEQQSIYLTRSMRLPVNLTLSQFLWVLQMIVAAAMFCVILSKYCFLADDTYGTAIGLVFLALGVGLYLLPVYLGTLWIKRYYPGMSLVGPSDDVIKQSLPARRSLFRYLPFV